MKAEKIPVLGPWLFLFSLFMFVSVISLAAFTNWSNQAQQVIQQSKQLEQPTETHAQQTEVTPQSDVLSASDEAQDIHTDLLNTNLEELEQAASEL